MAMSEAKALAEHGNRLRQLGNLVKAERVLKQSLSILEVRRGWQGYDGILAATLRSLGGCLLDAGIANDEGGKIREAERILRRGLVVAELDGEDFAIASALYELGRCLRELGDEQISKLGESEELPRRCVEIRETMLGPNDEMVATTLLELGICLAEAMRPAEAVHTLRHCLAIRDAKLDPSDIWIANTLHPLAVCLSKVGELEEARGVLRRCLAIQEACGGDDKLSLTLHVLGLHLLESGELTEAEEILRRCLVTSGPGRSCWVPMVQLDLAICRRAKDHMRWGRGTPVGSSTLHVLDQHDWEYEALCDQFRAKWLKSQPPSGVSIARIFSIQVDPAVRNKHDRYKLQTTWANPCQQFHCTSCNERCNFIVNPQREAPCGLSSCSVCSICMQGFKIKDNVGITARRTSFNLRYGEGVYFSSVSGKANDYARFSQKTAPDGRRLRCMFVAYVAKGNPYLTKEASLPRSKCPPLGFESVEGMVGPALNYVESVVYKEEAALPTHLIVYSMSRLQ